MSETSHPPVRPRRPRGRRREDWTVRAGAIGIALVALATFGLALAAALVTVLVAFVQ